jgi:hypothetical protein
LSLIADDVEEQPANALPAKRCASLTKAGNPCRSSAVGEDGLCAYHAGRTPLGTGEWAEKAAEGTRRARREKVEARRRDALDWAADLIAERGETIAKAFIHAAEKGDWRASEALMNRIYGKPEETVTRVDANPAAQVLKSMSLEEKLELLQRLQAGAQGVPKVIDP